MKTHEELAQEGRKAIETLLNCDFSLGAKNKIESFFLSALRERDEQWADMTIEGSRHKPKQPPVIETEFYSQLKWREIHRKADALIATKDGKILAALYASPDELLRKDYAAFVTMLKDWVEQQ